ncbi:hypothetical protein H9L05_10615 [Hymenobacter qilianensis]|uniref:Probable sensor domain-containing protein n=1 Tax=Hymenobacter qilianensis TaxID=1385715 RepID=A0A7H0H064_9BACT|nr:hypothetical protein [Hymenobacter qilianensis]QNP53930.1 hypothetical protein H9L05_10615 [Hymenobacter qilianensis]
MLSPLPLVSAPPVAPTMPLPAPGSQVIWAYQSRFQQAAQAIANGIFDTLDDDLAPDVLLMGIPVAEPDQQNEDVLAAVCLEPADCGLDFAHFGRVLARGQEFQLREPWGLILTVSR